jgi:hypothetical protein
VSPIFVRPVREQLEHDRLVRFLQQKYKRRFDVAINMGEEQSVPVKVGALTLYPDLVLTAGRKLEGVVEVESGESVNNLEAMAQWVHFSRSRVPFHLYVPVTSYETARRLCETNQAQVTEIWTYRPAIDGFDLVKMFSDAGARPAKSPVRPVAAGRPAAGAKPANAASPKARMASRKTEKTQPRGSVRSTARASARPGAGRKAPAGRAKPKSGGARRR